jgi:hypothetical protein
MTRDPPRLSRRAVLKTGAIATGGLLAGATGVATAETVAVPDDYPTIQAAVDAASEGDVVLVDGDGGPYREQVVVRKDLTVRGVNDPTLLPPAGGLGVPDIAVVQPIFGAVGYGNTVDVEGFTVDGEFATDKGGFYSCVGYYQADGTISDVTLERADYGAFLTQNLGGGGSQVNTLRDSTVRQIRTEPVAINERGTEARVENNVFEGIPGSFSFGVTTAFGATADIRRNTFRDFNGDAFSGALYVFDSAGNSIMQNTFENCDAPIFVQADAGSRFGGDADGNRIVKNSIGGDGSAGSAGVTLYANDPNSGDDAFDTISNTKIINNDFADFETGVAIFETGDGVVERTKFVRNDFENVDEQLSGGDQTTVVQANRVS